MDEVPNSDRSRPRRNSMNPEFGCTNLHESTCRTEVFKSHRLLCIRYPITIVAERETPARQWTRARPPQRWHSSRKEAQRGKYSPISAAASERSLIGQRRYARRGDSSSKKLLISSVALMMCVIRSVRKRSMSLAVTRSPRKRKSGRISPFHDSSSVTARALPGGLLRSSRLRLCMRGLPRRGPHSIDRPPPPARPSPPAGLAPVELFLHSLGDTSMASEFLPGLS
mmetsp:Transcript_6105/g.15511  ORF Transcript_6105/g.15511 Transcript_6105/m.15511 type:complete len:226 (-) Transcript_6105:256-933(-)